MHSTLSSDGQVLHGRWPWEEAKNPVPLPWSVGADDVANSVLALEKIREKGYERIAFVGGGETVEPLTAAEAKMPASKPMAVDST